MPDNPRKRKGHKKSRGGCYNCKRRKIKASLKTRCVLLKNDSNHVAYSYPLQCQENQPACHNCTRTNMSCKYPPPHVIKAIQKPASPVLETQNLQSTPTIFKASDMRLFHHFIMNAYPHLPLGNDGVWIREIPAFAHSVSLQSLKMKVTVN